MRRDDDNEVRSSSARSSVAVCIATFRRPYYLAALLESLASLEFRKVAAPRLRFVVIDNDVEESAREVVERMAARLAGPVTYEIESVRNISAARNRAARIALADGADFVAFVDDDERVPPVWLDELLAEQARSGADAVCGPVRPIFDGEMPRWVVRGGFFVQRRIASGTRLDWGQTGNSLIAAGALREREPFDLRFGLTGAEDTHFFIRLTRAGGRIAWCEEAAAEETVPVSRATMGWVLRRAFRVGNNYVACERALMPVREWLPSRLLGSIGRLALGVALAPPGVLLGRAGVGRALRIAAHGLGSLSALAGFRYEEYQSSHGR